MTPEHKKELIKIMNDAAAEVEKHPQWIKDAYKLCFDVEVKNDTK